MRFLPLLSAVLALFTSAVVADSIVLTLSAGDGTTGISAVQCNQGVLFFQINLDATINVNGIHAYQPMAELGLPTVTATFTINGAAATLTQQNAFNVASSTTSGNQWIFGLMDDGPHPGAQFTAGACTSSTATILVSFSSSAITDAQGLPNGADGGPAVPLVDGPVTVVNDLPAEFNGGANGSTAVTTAAATTAVTTVAATTAATAAATTAAAIVANVAVTTTVTVTVSSNTVLVIVTNTAANAATAVATTTAAAASAATTAASAAVAAVASTSGIVYTFTLSGGISVGCVNGAADVYNVGFQQTVSVNGGTAMSPMAETGLTTIHAAFYVNGVAATSATLGNTYNMADATTSANVWSWTMEDDEPNPGGAITLGLATACNSGDTLTVSIALSADPVTNANNVNGAVTVINNLPAANNAGTGSGSTTVVATTTAGAAAAVVTTAAAVATTAASGSTSATGTVTSTVSTNQNAANANCGGPSNSNLLLYMGTTISVKASGITNTACTNGPMAECGLPTLEGTVFFSGNSSAVNIISWTGGDQTFSGNKFYITEEDDMPYYGGTLVLNLPCSYTNNYNSATAALLGFKFVSLNSTVYTIDNAGNNVLANVAVITA
ncbi:hypothetical protein HDU82_008367 [Entophlyctis luteolus]|nr:hypothetical protein HDU82_008367 [Entophlyctis luteolus]